jgi:hypothetical protein
MVTWESPFKCPKCKTNLVPIGYSGVWGPYYYEKFKCGQCDKEYFWVNGPSMNMYIESERFNEVKEHIKKKIEELEKTKPLKPKKESQKSLLDFLKREGEGQ